MKYGFLIAVTMTGLCSAYAVSIHNSRAATSTTGNLQKNNTFSIRRKSPAMASVLEANKKLSSQIFYILAERAPDNFLYSPISLSAALMTLFIGADSSTSREIKRALNYQEIPDALLNAEFSQILSSLQENENGTIKLLNRLFVSPEFGISIPFEDTVRNQLFGEVLPVNLSDTQHYVKYVNDMVSSFTKERIHRFFTEVDIIPSSKAVQLNTIRFKSEWDRAFTPLLTQKRPFFTVEGEQIEIDMMLRGGDYPFAEIPELNSSVLSIPYKGNQLSFVIILPEREVDIKEVEENLKTFPMTSVLGRMSVQYIQLSMPRFEIDSKIDFIKTETLQKLGIKSMLSPQEATFNKISADQGLYINSVFQSTHIDIKEGGTESATANFVEAIPASFRFLTPFTVDRPFIFFIYDRTTETILFVGRKLR